MNYEIQRLFSLIFYLEIGCQLLAPFLVSSQQNIFGLSKIRCYIYINKKIKI